jgi:hypothetical protein
MANPNFGSFESGSMREKLSLVEDNEEEARKHRTEKDVFSRPLGKATLQLLRLEAPEPRPTGNYGSPDQ